MKLLRTPTSSQLESFQAEVIRRHDPSLLSVVYGVRHGLDTLDSTLSCMSRILEDTQHNIMPKFLTMYPSTQTPFVYRSRKVYHACRQLLRDIDHVRTDAFRRYGDILANIMEHSHA
jgi:hypothetical protein